MQFGQLIKNTTQEIIFSKKHAEIEAGKLVPDLFCFLEQLYVRFEAMASGLQLSFSTF